jgi:hypothetical protein
VLQCLGESLRPFIELFSQVQNTIPCFSNVSVIVEGVRDKKMSRS